MVLTAGWSSVNISQIIGPTSQSTPVTGTKNNGLDISCTTYIELQYYNKKLLSVIGRDTKRCKC